MKIREIVPSDEDPAGYEVATHNTFPITCVVCGDVAAYRTPGDDPGYVVCVHCHDDEDVNRLLLNDEGEFEVDLR